MRHLYTKIVGVTRINPDGTRRQDLIQRCQPDERLILEHEEDNPVDPNAIRVRLQSGEQLGYLRRGLAKEVVGLWRDGYRFGAYVKNLTGGAWGRHHGLNILILVAEPSDTDADAQVYADNLGRDAADLVVTVERRAIRERSQRVSPEFWILLVAVFIMFLVLGVLLNR